MTSAASPPGTETVFVHVREVNDFRSVVYEAISMLNVSATRELTRQLAAKDARIAALQKSVADLKAKDEARDTIACPKAFYRYRVVKR